MALPNPNDPEGPIIDIFKSLINNDTPPNVVLTNTHLINILQKEFYMDTGTMKKYELEIYINVLKNFLKIWPKWDTFGQTLDKLKEGKDQEGINRMLKKKYVEIKEYLSSMLNMAQDLSSNKVNELNMMKETKGEDVTLEVEGNVHLLRSLFYRFPINGSIFHANKVTLSVPLPKRFTLESIIHWFGVEIEMTARANKKTLVYKRQNLHKFNHRLVNKKLKEQDPCRPGLTTSLLVKSKNSCIFVSRADLMRLFKLSLSSEENTKWRSVSEILETVIDDLAHLPELIDISCDYRRHPSDRKYVRNFTHDVLDGEDMDKYDLHLEEVVSPLYEYNFKVSDYAENDVETSITLTCIYCQITFIGTSCVSDILRHFILVHMSEPDWKCLTCSKTFTMCDLTKMAWSHPCIVTMKD